MREVIVFDLGNTLIRFDHNISAKKIADLFGIDSKFIYDMFFDSPITRAFEKGEISPAQFHEKASMALGKKMPFNDFVDIWNDIFWEDEDSCRIARSLKAGGYTLFLLSNLNSLHFEHIRGKFGILDIFDELVLSFKVGAIKPERAIFDHVIKLAGGDRSRLVYIDDREDLIKEASAIGIDSIKFEGAGKLLIELEKRGIKGV